MASLQNFSWKQGTVTQKSPYILGKFVLNSHSRIERLVLTGFPLLTGLTILWNSNKYSIACV